MSDTNTMPATNFGTTPAPFSTSTPSTGNKSGKILMVGGLVGGLWLWNKGQKAAAIAAFAVAAVTAFKQEVNRQFG